MIVTTSATTVTTVTYLDLIELDNYKKQVQDFWLPFMEQFIPATTIWVAGERWCNKVCDIKDPCADFRYLTSPSTAQGKESTALERESKNSNFKSSTVLPINGTTLPSDKPNASLPKSLPNILPIKDLGLTVTSPITINVNVDIKSYRSRFTERKEKTIII